MNLLAQFKQAAQHLGSKLYTECDQCGHLSAAAICTVCKQDKPEFRKVKELTK